MNNGNLQRQLESLIKIGTIAAVDSAQNRVRVQHGGLVTDWLPYLVPSAGGVSVWRLPSEKEMCLVLSPSGETENGVVLCGIHSDSHPAPSNNPAETVVKFPDGAVIKHNHQSGAMEITGVNTAKVQAKTSVEIDTPQTNITGKLNVKGLLTYSGGMSGSGGGGTSISGALNHSGTLTNNGSITSNGISLSGHTHTGDSGGKTSTPQ